MPSINLTTENVSGKTALSLGTGTIISATVLALIFCIYGTLLIVNKNINAKTKRVVSEYEAEYNKFLSGSGGDVIDFKNRSMVAKKLLDEGKPSREIFSKLEEAILPSVYLNSLKYDEDNKVIDLDCAGDSLNVIAKQIASFKQNDVFSSVGVGQISLDNEMNNLNFPISLKLK